MHGFLLCQSESVASDIAAWACTERPALEEAEDEEAQLLNTGIECRPDCVVEQLNDRDFYFLSA